MSDLAAFAASGVRGCVERAKILSDVDIARLLTLDVVASFQPEHAMDDRDVADHRWAGRTGGALAFGSLVRAGVRMAFGSDSPVAPLDEDRCE